MSHLLKDYFQDILDMYPSFGSFLGIRKYDGFFENVLDARHERKLQYLLHKYNRLLKTMTSNKPSLDEKILRWVLDDLEAGMKFPFQLLPISSFENPLIDFTFQNRTLYKLRTQQDFQNLIRRHQCFAPFIICAIRNMKKGVQQKVVLPRLICEKAVQALEDFLAEEKFLFHIPPRLQRSHLYATYLRTMQEHERLLRKIATFMRFEYLPHCRESIGMYDLPKGKKMYLYAVKNQLTTHMDPEKIYQFGVSEVRRISQAMRSLQLEFGYPATMSLTAFYQHMLHDPKLQFLSRNQTKKAFESKRDEIRATIMPRFFENSVQTYDIQRVPTEMEKTSAGAFYMPGSMDRKRKGVFYLNQRNLSENPKYTVTALALHEGEPGHHYQYQYMIEKNIPLHRIYSVTGNSFVEGWALYAESLGKYDKRPIDLFGRLTYELFRSVRLVVDTGIHWKGWSYERAVAYMKKHLAMSSTEIEAEVQRYICIPGQALCYKIGEAKLQSWKKLYIQKHGEGDDSLRAFHEVVLEDGVLPLDVLEEKVHTKLGLRN